jgi:ornithine carbamoyltransferase
MKRDFLTLDGFTRAELDEILHLSARLKRDLKAGQRPPLLAGKTLAMIFEKPSLRTRVTFEVGMTQLGGAAVYLAAQDIGLGTRESVADVARNLGRWVNGIAARTFEQATVERLARHAGIPVINALTDHEHPCQALADFFTLWERGLDLSRLRMAWVGDGNNVCHSLVLLAARLGTEVSVACPPGYEPAPRVVETARALGGRVAVTADPHEAAAGADVLYTDVWVSMGQEAERERRLEAFSRYQLSEPLLAAARPSAVVMHCLPAHRGEEISEAVLDGPQSVVLDQAENRLHVQKAVLLTLLGQP